MRGLWGGKWEKLGVETRGLEWLWWGSTTEGGYAGVRWHGGVVHRLFCWLGIVKRDGSHLMILRQCESILTLEKRDEVEKESSCQEEEK